MPSSAVTNTLRGEDSWPSRKMDIIGRVSGFTKSIAIAVPKATRVPRV